MNNSVPRYAAHVNELLLLKHLTSLFPNEKIIVNSKKEHDYKYPDSGSHMEFDIWLPDLLLAFEFQDSYHYITTWYKRLPQQQTQLRDYYKSLTAMENKINLIHIPIWWDGTLQSLAATIKHHRPDLLLGTNQFSNLIPLSPLLNFFTMPTLPKIPELMLASFAPSSSSSSSSEYFEVVPCNWWLGEKYDGVRCFWDSSTRTAYTRSGRTIALHPRLAANLPSPSFTSSSPHDPSLMSCCHGMDCELWCGRGQYHHAVVVAYESDDSSRVWEFLRLISFDIVELNLPFEVRYGHLLQHTNVEHPTAIVASRTLCESHSHQHKFSLAILNADGEGAILRQVGSLYECGRSSSLIKIKNVTGEREAIVSRIGSDGSMRLKLPSGITIDVASTDVHVKAGVGDIVTVSHQLHSRRDVPVSPAVLKVRTDMKWEDVIASYHSDATQSEDNFKTKPHRHWTTSNIRAFLERFAQSRGLDPLVPSTWSAITSSSLKKVMGGNGILSTFKGNFHDNINKIFPEINFKSHKKSKLWKSHYNFFVSYAKKRGFDPLIPQNWYQQTKIQILKEKGGRSVLRFYGGKVRALLTIFPNIGLSSISSSEANHKNVFEKFAAENGFDPLVLTNWNATVRKKALANQKIKLLLDTFYHKNINQALAKLFFPRQQSSGSTVEHLNFFITYAKERGFDPLVASNWYSQTRLQIHEAKGAKKVLSFFGNDYRKALLVLFPSIGLDEEQLNKNKATMQRFVNLSGE